MMGVRCDVVYVRTVMYAVLLYRSGVLCALEFSHGNFCVSIGFW